MIALWELFSTKRAAPEALEPRDRKARRRKARERTQARRRVWRKVQRAANRIPAQPVPLAHQHAAQRRRAGMHEAARRAALEAAKHVSLRGSRRRKRSTR